MSQYYECRSYVDDLPPESVKTTVLCRQDNGYLWIGSEKGLIRYDGDATDLFLRKTGGSQKVTALIAEGDSLWVGYDDGGLELFYKEKLWSRIDSNAAKSPVTGIKILSDGSKILTTYGSGIIIYTSGGQIFNYNKNDGLLSDEIYCAEKTEENTIVIGTDSGVQVVRVMKGGLDCETSSKYEVLKNHVIYSLAWDTTYKVMAAGTFENGFYIIKENGSFFQYQEGNTITHVTGNKSGEFYFLVPRQSDFFRFDISSMKPAKLTPCHEEKPVGEILFLDSAGLIWLYSSKQGIYSMDSRYYTVINNVRNIQTLDICDSLLFFADENQLFEYKTSQSFPVIKNSGIHILCMNSDCERGKLYCGTFGSGIMIFDFQKNKTSFITENEGLLNNNVLSIARIGQELWAATLGGITVWNLDTGNFRYITEKEGLTTGYNYSVFIDSEKNVWVGTDGYGLLNINDKGIISSIPSRHNIISIAEDGRGNIWYCTTSDGLYRVIKNSANAEKFEKGISAVIITGIIRDLYGNICVFHPNGMDIIDIETEMVRNYGYSQHFRQINAHMHALTRDQKGRIWFCDETRIIRYTPSDGLNSLQLNVQKFDTEDDHEDKDKNGALLFHNNDLQIVYTAIWLDNPEAPKFRYKIEGLTDDWIYTKDRKLIMSNLRPGPYTFVLQSDIQDGFTWPAVYEQSFVILTPFYKTIWFLAICVVLCFLVALQILRTKEKRKRQIEQLTTEKIRSELNMIKSQIDPHFLFNSFNTLISTIETDKDAALQFAERMSNFYRTILEYREKDRISLDEELRICSDYVYLLQARFGSNLSIDDNIKGAENYYIIPLTLQIVIENVVKHNIVSSQYPLKIDLFTEDSTLVVRNPVRLRRDKSPSTHFGLDALMKRYKEYTGRVMTSGQTGDCFEVRIPLQKIE